MISIGKEVLVNALSFVLTNNPGTCSIKCEGHGDILTFSSMSDVFLEVKTKAQFSESFKGFTFGIQVRPVLAFAKGVLDGIIEINVDGDIAEFTCGNSMYKTGIVQDKAHSYNPDSRFGDFDIVVNKKDFLESIKYVSWANTRISNPLANIVSFVFSNKAFVVQTTDAVRAVTSKVGLYPIDTDKRYNLLSVDLSNITKFSQINTETVTISVNDIEVKPTVTFLTNLGDIRYVLQIKIVDISFPNIDEILEKEYNLIEIEATPLKTALGLSTIFGKIPDTDNISEEQKVYLKFGDEKLQINTESYHDKFNTEMEVETKDDFEVSFNKFTLASLLPLLSGDTIKFNYISPDKGVIFDGVNDTKFLLAPTRCRK